MHALGAAQCDAAMVIFEPAGSAHLCSFASFFCALTDLCKQGARAAEEPGEQNATGETKDKRDGIRIHWLPLVLRGAQRWERNVNSHTRSGHRWDSGITGLWNVHSVVGMA